jgi:protein involved in polysaccharide export with SLBB domain
VAAGTQIVLQIHYNLLATNGKPGPVDQSSARLRIMPGTAAVTPLTGLRLVAPLITPIRLRAGDALRVTCTYDATLRAQLPELKPLQPRYVVWGDGTSDEMCLATLVGTTKL